MKPTNLFLICVLGMGLQSWLVHCKVGRMRGGKKTNSRIVQLNQTRKVEHLNIKQPKVSFFQRNSLVTDKNLKRFQIEIDSSDSNFFLVLANSPTLFVRTHKGSENHQILSLRLRVHARPQDQVHLHSAGHSGADDQLVSASRLQSDASPKSEAN